MTTPDDWLSCDKYACGVCLGSSALSVLFYQSSACKQGFVWREAVTGEYVCVPPADRSEAVADNTAAQSRVHPGGGAFGKDTCKQGCVWRGVNAQDHVCVDQSVHAEVAAANALGPERTTDPQPNGPDTCKQGYVWRDAVPNDHVCVITTMRAQAAQDNANAAARRMPNGGAWGADTCK